MFALFLRMKGIVKGAIPFIFSEKELEYQSLLIKVAGNIPLYHGIVNGPLTMCFCWDPLCIEV